MICPYCGKENPEDLDICQFCGAPLTEVNHTPVETGSLLEPDYTVIDTPPQPEVLPPPPPQVFSQPPPSKPRNRIWWLVGCAALVLLSICCIITMLVFFQIAGRISSNPAVTLIPSINISLLPTEIPSVDLIPGAAPTSAPSVLFSDDFSDPSSGWDKVTNSDYLSDYYQDAYRITVNADMYDSWANPDKNNFGDVRIEAEATKNGGPDDNDFGLICRYVSTEEFYYGVISSDGFYGIFKVTSESATLLGSDEMRPSDAIRQGGATNQMRFDCVGDVLTLYVNGEQVDQQTDRGYSTGNVGLIAGTYDTPGTDILFDNFTVLQP
jgi:hypothetical protein